MPPPGTASAERPCPTPWVSGQGGDPRVFPEASLRVRIAIGEPIGAMAEEQRDLISDRGSAVLNTGDTQRSALRRKAAFSTVSILIALLIAGQAVTIYFVYQQSGQISKLTKTSQSLQLEALQRKLPATGAKPVNKMKMVMANSPMVMRMPHPDLMEDLEVMGPASNKTEDIVKHLLLQADPSKKFPELKDSPLDNLKKLRKTLTYTDWKSFESWLDKWLLFEKVKNPESEERKAVPAEKVQTKCQAEARFGNDQLGHFRPQCDENGDYLPKQCHFSTGFCWCCYKNGTKIEGTATRGKLDCPDTDAPAAASSTTEPEEMIFSGVDGLKLSASKVN